MLKESRALETDCYVIGFGAFGIFFRWMQLMLSRTEEGVFDPGFWNFALPILMLSAAIVYIRSIHKLKKENCSVPDDFCSALKNDGRVYSICRIVFSAAMVIGSLILFAQSETDQNQNFLRAIAIAGVIAGVSFYFLLTSANKASVENRNLASFLSTIPVLLFAVWLVTCYKQNSISGVGWDYITEIAAVSAAMIAFMRIAGFAYGVPNWKRSMFWSMMGATLCIMTLSDERYIGQQIMFGAAAFMLLMYNWILLSNMKTGRKAYSGQDSAGFEHLNI